MWQKTSIASRNQFISNSAWRKEEERVRLRNFLVVGTPARCSSPWDDTRPPPCLVCQDSVGPVKGNQTEGGIHQLNFPSLSVPVIPPTLPGPPETSLGQRSGRLWPRLSSAMLRSSRKLIRITMGIQVLGLVPTLMAGRFGDNRIYHYSCAVTNGFSFDFHQFFYFYW